MREKALIDSLNGKTSKRPPFWFMRQAGRYLSEYRELRSRTGGFIDLCLNRAASTEVTLQPIRRFDPDAAILFSDILIVPYGLGMDVRFEEGKGPILDAVRDAKGLDKLSINKNWARIESTYETVDAVRSQLGSDKTLIGFSGSPWTVATYMVEGKSSKDYAIVKGWAYRETEVFERLINLLVAATIKHLSLQIDSGADVIKIFDTWAGVLSPAEYQKWVIKPSAEICSELKRRYPDVKIIGFPKGVGVGYIDFVSKVDVDGVAVDTSVPPKWAAEFLQNKVTVQGNLDPIVLTEGGDKMIDQARNIRESLQNGPFIFNLGHGVLPNTPVENLIELAEFLKTPLE
ncbi:MAG: uroporphyrinogen decarboxylase [Rhodospirillaceae bacterium]|nr:uroporphyrinogen decarboxylase [Rhodospirillaceae bacterium]|tara:strand:- start:3602 stop:4636 length:1035 start_codon:yes stop_codon:yes gene_type:complete